MRYDIIDSLTNEVVAPTLHKGEAETQCYSLNDEGLISRYVVRRSKQRVRQPTMAEVLNSWMSIS